MGARKSKAEQAEGHVERGSQPGSERTGTSVAPADWPTVDKPNKAWLLSQRLALTLVLFRALEKAGREIRQRQGRSWVDALEDARRFI